MLLQGKTAVIYGGGGAIGGAMARTFARDGASVFIAGRSLDKLEHVVADVRAAGGLADVAQVDVMDPVAVADHVEHIRAAVGRIDIAANAIGIVHVQGPPLAELNLDDFLFPLTAYMRANFNIAKAVAKPMSEQGSGVILTLSTPGSRVAGTGFLGYGVTCAATETFSRLLAAELGGRGVRTICLRADAIPEALPISHARKVFEGFAGRAGMSVEEMFAARARQGALLQRPPTLREVAEFAAFAASDRAGAMTGAIANLTCGMVVD